MFKACLKVLFLGFANYVNSATFNVKVFNMIQALIPQLLPILGGVLDATISDKQAKAKAIAGMQAALVSNADNISLETIKTNQTEAAHRSVWVAGWRPAIGWSLAAGIFWMLIGFPLMQWTVSLFGIHTPLPNLPTDILFELTLAMLGMSAVRSFDKVKGLSK